MTTTTTNTTNTKIPQTARPESLAPSLRWSAPALASAPPLAPLPPLLVPGSITFITGPSGAGKTTVLRSLREQQRASDQACAWIDVGAIPLPPDVPIVNAFGEDADLLDVLKLLGRVGLGEVWTYLRTADELSEGQRFRLGLAMALHAAMTFAAGAGASSAGTAIAEGAPPRVAVVACDEFAAVLDRLTAMIVSRCLRRAIDGLPGVAAVVATSHDDLVRALCPDAIVHCDFGRVRVEGRVEPRMDADERR